MIYRPFEIGKMPAEIGNDACSGNDDHWFAPDHVVGDYGKINNEGCCHDNADEADMRTGFGK